MQLVMVLVDNEHVHEIGVETMILHQCLHLVIKDRQFIAFNLFGFQKVLSCCINPYVTWHLHVGKLTYINTFLLDKKPHGHYR